MGRYSAVHVELGSSSRTEPAEPVPARLLVNNLAQNKDIAMSKHVVGRLRPAQLNDAAELVRLWGMLFDANVTSVAWRDHAREWFHRMVDQRTEACFPLIEVEGRVVATSIGTIELGVPNPYCPRGRSVRLSNVITLPAYRRNGYGSLLVHEVVRWAQEISADRVDLSSTPEGGRIYERAGFVRTDAPRMKLTLSNP